LVRAVLTIPAGATAGNHAFRLVTRGGVTNEAKVRVTAVPTVNAPRTIGALPVVVQGVLSNPGTVNSYWIEAKAGEKLTIEVVSGFPGFDPSVSVWAPADSWFRKDLLEQVAFNDDPLYFPGLDKNARLEYKFPTDGRYAIRVGAFSGAGGPDFVYQMLVTTSATPKPDLHPLDVPEWTERLFTRPMGQEWLAHMAARGLAGEPGPLERYRAVPVGSKDIPVMTPNGIVEGRLSKAAETHVIRLKLDKPEELAIEIETTEATMPRFNPVVRLMQPDGYELVTNVYTKRNNNGLYMMKMIQAKTTVAIRAGGEYRMEIRDITTDCWAPDFAYRVLVRRAIPHIGKIDVTQDRVNLEPGESKPVNIQVEREEGFHGYVAITVEGLPPGVTAVTGLENPVEKPPLPNGGRLERYVGIPQNSTVLLVAAADARISEAPCHAIVVVRPMVDGKLGEVILRKNLPVMVVARRPS
jgi:hypothetical protein